MCGGHRTLYPSTATRWIPFHCHSLGPQIPAVTWLSLTGISAPPRDPNNNNDEDEEDEDEDEEDKREPAVIREPDEDE